MARPSAEVILTVDHETGQDDILLAQGIWQVTYRGLPIAIRNIRYNRLACKHKYPRTTFHNAAHAHRLAAQLNEQTNTKDFDVIEIELIEEKE
jgi:hypothetical protein